MPNAAAKTETDHSFSIDVNNLTGLSQLKQLLNQEAKPVFDFGTELSTYIGKPISNIPNNTKASLSISENAGWKTATGIGFSLTPTLTCSAEIITSGAVLTYKDSLNATADSNLPTGAYAGSCYIKLSLGFSIGAKVSGSGSAGPVGISGNASGSTEASVVCCHRVDGNMFVEDALHDAFEHFVFPLEPATAKAMQPGDVAQCNFRAKLALGAAATYGLGDIKYSAQDVTSTISSASKGIVTATPSGVEINFGLEASVKYTHEDNFSAIIEKLDGNTAFLDIMRADKSDLTAGVSANAAVTVNTGTVTPDQAQLAKQINALTHGLGGAAAASKASDIAASLQGKLQNSISNALADGAGLGLSADRQTARSMLYKYQITLDDAAINSTWNALSNGDLQSAAFAQGVRPLPGSGVENDLKSSLTLDLHFFNAFKAESVNTFFQNSSVVVTDTGALRYIYDVGKGNETQVGGALSNRQIHFVARADQTNPNTITAANVDLQFDLIAQNNVNEARNIAETVAEIARTYPEALDALAAMRAAALAHSSTLTLTCILKLSAYKNITCSPYNRKPPVDQTLDQENWQAFYDATMDNYKIPQLAVMNYEWWRKYNRVCNNGSDDGKLGDRGNEGNIGAPPPGFYPGSDQNLYLYFLLNTTEFMNLCDDLNGMAQQLSKVPTVDAWNSILKHLARFTADTNPDYSIPAIAALLQRSTPAAIDYTPTINTNSFTCTLIIS